jgi:hypothetical protein
MVKKYGLWVFFCSILTVHMTYFAIPFTADLSDVVYTPVNWLFLTSLLCTSAFFAAITFVVRYFFLVRKARQTEVEGMRVVFTLGCCWLLSVLVAANGVTAFFLWHESTLMFPFTFLALFLMWFHSPLRVPHKLIPIKVKVEKRR